MPSLNGLSAKAVSPSDLGGEPEEAGLMGPPGTLMGKDPEKNRFRMTTFDILTNPLRADHPFGKLLQPYLLALYLSIIKTYYQLRY
jgi:hypothetical protein